MTLKLQGFSKVYLMSVLKKISNYFSLVKFSHTIFAMPFALSGFTLGVSDSWHKGEGTNVFGWTLFLKMILCMVSARSAAMSFNRFLDRRYDALNPRTARREIPAGVISPANALTFTILSSLVFFTVIPSALRHSVMWFLGWGWHWRRSEPI